MNRQLPSQRIAADLREQIARGDYRPGQQLPSNAALMAHYDVARQTVQNAMDQLRAEGLVIGRRGAGVFVRDVNIPTDLTRTQTNRSGGYVVERVTTRYATPDDAHTAQVPSGALVYAITRTTHDPAGNVTDVEQSLIPADQYALVYEAPVG